MDQWESERITALTYLGLAFMALTALGMVCCTVWMFTW